MYKVCISLIIFSKVQSLLNIGTVTIAVEYMLCRMQAFICDNIF